MNESAFLTPPDQPSEDSDIFEQENITEDDEESDNDNHSPHHVVKKRGVKCGGKRQCGKYKRARESVKRRVIDAANRQEDWQIVALNNNVNVSTARRWIKNGTPTELPRGGVKNIKILDEHKAAITNYIEENSQITLKKIQEKLLLNFNLHVSISAINNHCDGLMFTLKKVHEQPVTMNLQENKIKRRDFVAKLMQFTGEGKFVVYTDETNVNLFTKRSYGRAKNGNRAISRNPSCKGPNVHIIGAISQQGLEYWEKHRGKFRSMEAKQWVRNLLNKLIERGHNLEDVVIVIDNAPCHSKLEEVFQEENYNQATLLRLGPYSAPINPIEAVWSFMKAKFKELHSARMTDMLNNVDKLPNDNQTTYRLKYLEALIVDSIVTITPIKCLNCCNHVMQHYPNIMALGDLQVGV